jgi:hypothetical protein
MLEWTAREGISRFIVIVLVAASAAGCVSGGLSTAHVSLASEPLPDTRTLDLLLTYIDCADGKVPTDVESVSVEETDDAVILEVLVPLPRHLIWEGYTCQAGRGWLPFTFELPEPLGDRTLKYRMMPENQDIDVGVVVLP